MSPEWTLFGVKWTFKEMFTGLSADIQYDMSFFVCVAGDFNNPET